jgi:uncharacterized membrane protein YfcA
MTELALVALASLFAGCVDAIVGGGGLILVPALFGMYPGAAPATLLGTNKGSGIWGTGWATLQFARRVQLPWKSLLPAAVAALAGSFAGAWALVAVLAYTLARKDLGRDHAPRLRGAAQTATACAIGAAVGAYDGFFGPGAGSFFVFLFVRLLGFDFLHASASAKLLNTATNAAALLLLAAKGHVWWHVAAVLALANVTGSLIGTRLALRHGAGFVRGAFIVVVTALIAKTGWDAFLR